MHKVYRNNKTGNLYRYLHTATSATNGQEGIRMVVYENDREVYVRQANEFYNKFTLAYDPSNP